MKWESRAKQWAWKQQYTGNCTSMQCIGRLAINGELHIYIYISVQCIGRLAIHGELRSMQYIASSAMHGELQIYAVRCNEKMRGVAG